jgi:hypothetical protein
MTPPKHWQDPLNAVIGVLILVSPWLAGYALAQPALANAVIVGMLLFTVSVQAVVIGRPWVECAVVALGAWMLASPWVLAFADERSSQVAFVLGSVVLVLGAGALAVELNGRIRAGGGVEG